jgi:hypothetical protein
MVLAFVLLFAVLVPASPAYAEHAELVPQPERQQLHEIVIDACQNHTDVGNRVLQCAGSYWRKFVDHEAPPVIYLTWHIHCWQDSHTERISEWQTVEVAEHRVINRETLEARVDKMADECPQRPSSLV